MRKIFILISFSYSFLAEAQWTGQSNSSDLTTSITRTGSVGITGTGSYLTLTSRVAGGSNGTILFQNGTSNNLVLAETAADNWTMGYGTAGAAPTSIFSWNASKNVTFAGKILAGRGDSWTTSYWSKSMEIPNSSVLKWTSNANGWRFGIGQTDGGLYFVRNGADDTSLGARYDMFISEAGYVGIGTASPSYNLDVQGWGARVKNTSSALNAYTTFRVQGPDYTNGLEIDFFGNNNITSDPAWSYSGGAGSAAIMNVNAKPLVLGTGNQPRMLIDGNGKVGIGTSSPDFPLTVNGSIHAKEVRVDLTGALSVPDYVFEKDYKLASLEEIKTYIDQNKHLPEVPSAKEIEKNGVQLGEMNLILLKKIEELTLYVIELKKENETLSQQKGEMETLKFQLEALAKKLESTFNNTNRDK